MITEAQPSDLVLRVPGHPGSDRHLHADWWMVVLLRHRHRQGRLPRRVSHRVALLGRLSFCWLVMYNT